MNTHIKSRILRLFPFARGALFKKNYISFFWCAVALAVALADCSIIIIIIILYFGVGVDVVVGFIINKQRKKIII